MDKVTQKQLKISFFEAVMVKGKYKKSRGEKVS